jgi:hypothetical protein
MGEYPISWRLAEAIEATHLSDREKDGLFSLLQDPIRWESDFVVEGKHRSCALRQCEAPEIVRGTYGPAGYAYTWRMGDNA